MSAYISSVSQSVVISLMTLMALSSCNKDGGVEPALTLTFAPDQVPVFVDPYPEFDTNAVNREFRKTYVEMFTGHKCVSGPANSEYLINQLEERYDRTIAVFFHEGGFAIPDPPRFPTDFRTDYGGVYHDNVYSPLAPYPGVIINRRSFSNFDDTKIFYSAGVYWDAPIDFENTNTYTRAGIGLAVDYADSTDKLYIHVGLEELDGIPDIEVLLLITEDNVISAQKDSRVDPQVYPDKIIPDYSHRHVFRDTVQTKLVSALDSWQSFKGTRKLPENVYEINNLSVVALAIDVFSQEIIQSEKVEVYRR